MLLEEPLSNDRPAKASSMLAVPLSLPSSTSSKDALELRASDADRADAPRERLEREAMFSAATSGREGFEWTGDLRNAM
jgi:hypothetical protein